MKYESVILELQRATHSTLRVLAAELVDLDLTPSELNALGSLADGGGRTVSQLGAAVGSRPTTLTGVLDRLERRGLITRGPSPGDRRAVLIEPTADGALMAARIHRVLRALERRALTDLPPAALASARAVLQAFTELGT